jgi:hypothetical protein
MNAQLISIESAKLHLYLLKRWKEIRCFVIAFFFFFSFFFRVFMFTLETMLNFSWNLCVSLGSTFQEARNNRWPRPKKRRLVLFFFCACFTPVVPSPVG